MNLLLVKAGSGTLERTYQIRHYRALLIRKPKSLGPVKCLYLLVVVTEKGQPRFTIAAERSQLTAALMEMASERFPHLKGKKGGTNYFLGMTDEKGLHHNLGASPDWTNLDKLAARALQIAQDHLQLYGVIELTRRNPLLRFVPAIIIAVVLIMLGYIWFQFSSNP